MASGIASKTGHFPDCFQSLATPKNILEGWFAACFAVVVANWDSHLRPCQHLTIRNGMVPGGENPGVVSRLWPGEKKNLLFQVLNQLLNITGSPRGCDHPVLRTGAPKGRAKATPEGTQLNHPVALPRPVAFPSPPDSLQPPWFAFLSCVRENPRLLSWLKAAGQTLGLQHLGATPPLRVKPL